MTFTGQAPLFEWDSIPYWIIVPDILTLRMHLEASIDATLQFQGNVKGFTAHVKATFVNGQSSFDSRAQCNGATISLSTVGDCTYVTPSVSGTASLKFSPAWLQLGFKNLGGTGINAYAALSPVYLGFAAGSDQSVPGLFGVICAAGGYWEWEFKLPNAFGPGQHFKIGADGKLILWTLATVPSSNAAAAGNCPLGAPAGFGGNGPVAGEWGSNPPAPPP